MNKILYFELLEYLSINGVDGFVDVTHLIQKVKLPPDSPEATLFIQSRQIGFLNVMKSSGFIDFISTQIPNETYLKIDALIMPAGLKFLYDVKIANSTIILNEISVRNYKTQTLLSITTILIAATAAAFSVLDYLKPEPKMAELNRHIQQLTEEVKALQPHKTTLPTPLTYPKGSSHKP